MTNYKKEHPDGISLGFWQKFVSPRVIEQRNNKCEECGNKEKLEVHHKDYSNVRLSTLKVLCRKCHKNLHQEIKRKDVKRWKI